MLDDYEKLRLKQLRFLEDWNKSFVIPARKNKNHHNFSLSYSEIYAIRLDDLVYFAKSNNMEFEYEVFMDNIIFRDIKK